MEKHRKPAITLISEGYAKTEKQHLEKGTQNEAEKEGDVTDYTGRKQNRELTTIEKMAMGYDKEGLQKNSEIVIDPNEIKEGKE